MATAQSISNVDIEQEIRGYASHLWERVQRDAVRFGSRSLTGGLVDWAMHDE